MIPTRVSAGVQVEEDDCHPLLCIPSHSPTPSYPDCVRNAPLVHQFAKTHNLPLLIINVGGRTSWKDPAHPLRSDPVLSVTGVPTVATWVPPGQPGHVIAGALEDASTPAEVASVLQQLLRE